MKREDLTTRQAEVVAATEKVVLVLGGPGTGKTTTALWAARDMLERPGVAPWQRVLFLTFSRTAVSLIARRAPGVFGTNRDRIEIATFHGFGWRLIRAFGRYSGHGRTPPILQSEARAKLFGHDETRLTYDDLLPAATALLKSRRLRATLVRRWPLIICDEFQDTNEQQWRLLKALGSEARLLLLGDVNQMIYTFLKEQGVGPERLEHARRLADRVIQLEIHSHRDPSGTIPAMADAVRRRDFTHQAVAHAVRNGRLYVLTDVNSEEDEALAEVISTQVARVRMDGARSIGIFGHSNQGIASLSAALAQSGLDHVLIGLPEAHAEALSTLATLCARGVGLVTEEEVRSSFATFLTACTRGRSAPELARKLAHGLPLPLTLEQRLRALERALQDAAEGTMAGLVAVACQGWEAIGITSGVRPWRQASPDFVTLTRRLASLPASQDSVRALLATTERRRPSALVEFDSPQVAPIQLMNFYQTKGREADAVLLVYRTGDYLADHSDNEPYEEPSRVLFVSLTRARQQVVVILPPDLHPLIEPFAVWSNEGT